MFPPTIDPKNGSWSTEHDFPAWMGRLSFAVLTEEAYLSSARVPCEVSSLPDGAGVSFAFRGLEGRLEFVESGPGHLVYRVLVRNTGTADLRLRKIWPVQHDGGLYGPVKVSPRTRVLTMPAERSYGDDGPKDLETSRTITSYWQVAAHDPESGAGFVAGVAERARTFARYHMQPIVGNDAEVARTVQWSCELDCHSGARGVRIRPGAEFDGGLHLLHVWRGPAGDGLDFLVQQLRKFTGIEERPKIPQGWCSWYAGYFEEFTQAELEKNCAVAREVHGLEYMLIDGGWWSKEIGTGTLGEPQWETAKFPLGMRHAAESISAAGLAPGLHMRPWLGWEPRPEGIPAWTRGSCINLSHPEALEYLRELCRWTCARWGYRLLKLDFLAYEFLGHWGNALPGDLVTSLEPYDDTLTNAQIYANALAAMREGAGPEVYIIGCNSFHGLSYGLVDANRMGDDVSTRAVSWDRTFQMGVKCVAPFQHLNGQIWANDPDCLLFQEPLPIKRARLFAVYASLSGQAALASSKLYELDAERLGLLRACLPSVNSGVTIPDAVFESNPVDVLVAGDCHGLFNWTGERVKRRIELRGQGGYMVSEFFTQEAEEVFADHWEVELEPEGCAVVAVRPLPGHPAIAGTTSHPRQGLVELKERWDEVSRTLYLQAAEGRPEFTVTVYVPEEYGTERFIRVPSSQREIQF
jgi:hypothetical protein